MMIVNNNLMSKIAEFHEHFGIEPEGKNVVLSKELLNFRIKFLEEELNELKRAQQQLENGFSAFDCKVQMVDALVDLVYVALGTAYLMGVDFNAAFHAVHNANMKKVNAKTAADSKRGYAGDIVKPPGWVGPEIELRKILKGE